MTEIISTVPPTLAPEIDRLLTPTARSILTAGGPSAYSALIVRGDGNEAAGKLLGACDAGDLLAGAARGSAADAVLAGLWLWHDWLDASHELSQGIGSATGSFWHARMQ